jgi:Zn-dependent protease/CBS domain-containing protein
MPLMGGFSLGRWFGFEVRIDYSWFLIFFLVMWTFSVGVFPHELPGYPEAAYWTMGVVAALLLFLSVLLHELSHSAVARTRGIRVEGITLFIFGGVAQTSMEATRPVDEFLLTAAGPLCSVALSGIFYGLAVAADFAGLTGPITEVAGYLAFLNLALAVFNLVPGFPLDGGRLFRSAMWQITGDLRKATRWATTAGRGFGYLMMLVGLWFLWQGALLNGLWLAFIGWFLSNAATNSWRQFVARRMLTGVPVARALKPLPAAVDAERTLADVIDEPFLRAGVGAVPVLSAGNLVGVLSVEDVAGVSPAERSSTRVGSVMTPIERVPSVPSDASLESVLGRLRAGDGARLLVVDEGRLVGILTPHDIAGWLERARRLGMDREEGRGGHGGGTHAGPGPQTAEATHDRGQGWT